MNRFRKHVIICRSALLLVVALASNAFSAECSYVDDFGNTSGAASPVSEAPVLGQIEVDADRDFFSLATVPFGDYRIQVSPAGADPVSDIGAELLDEDGITPLARTYSTGANDTAVLHWNGRADAPLLFIDVRSLGEFSSGDYLCTLTTSLTNWTYGGQANWFSQTSTIHDGIAALQSGGIGSSESSWVETSITGPGTIQFWWNVSSHGSDYLRVYLDGVLEEEISGSSGWQYVEINIPAGAHTLRWAYEKDGSESDGEDAGWLSEVVFEDDCTFTLTPGQETFESAGGTGTIDISVDSTCSWVAEESLDWVTLTGGTSGSGNGQVSYSVSENTTTNSRSGIITAGNQTFLVSQSPNLLACMVPNFDATVTELRPTFTWCTVPEATWYQIYITKDGVLFHSQWLEQTDGDFTPDFDFPCGSYSWWIQSWSFANGTSPWVGPASFERPCCVPSEPAPLIPVDYAEGFGDVTYTWLASINECATWYQLMVNLNGASWHSEWINTGEGSGPVFHTVSGHGYGNYTWWIRGWGTDGYSPWSSGSDFTLGAITPESLSETELCYDEPFDSEATWLQAWINREGINVMSPWFDLASNTNDCVTLPQALLPGQYEVYTRGWSEGGGTGPWSTASNFVLGVVDPVSLSSSQVCWDGSAAAIYSWVEVYIGQNGSTVVNTWIDLATTTGSCAALSDSLEDGTYDVWIRGWGAATGMGPWSNGTEFTFP